jgi:hypothetical protein
MTARFNAPSRALPLGLAAGATVLAAGLIVTSPAAAAAPSASVANDTLIVIGSSGDDRIALRLQAGAPGVLGVDFGDDGTAEFSFDRSTFSRIEVSTGNGSDQFRIDHLNGTFADEPVTIDSGNGDDVLSGGDANEVFITGRGSDEVDGNRGSDTALLGSGSDSFRWDPGDGSDVVEGGSGPDTLDFNGAPGVENMSLSPNGGRSLFLRDPGTIRMDMDDVERLDLTTLGGADTVAVNDMRGTDFRLAELDLAAPTGGGDGAADVVTVNGTGDDDAIDVVADDGRVEVDGLQTEVRLTGSETIDLLQINALDGDDEVEIDPDVAGLIATAVDLGPGQI